MGLSAFNRVREQRAREAAVANKDAQKKQAAKNIQMHIVDGDESLRDIAQRYGVQMKSLEKMNSFVSGTELREGDVVKLRKR